MSPSEQEPVIDRLVHEPARYRILAQLYVVEGADFLFMLNSTGLTKGNLSSHVARLEKAGYVAVEKGYRGRKAHTMMRITREGRKAFEGYREVMKGMLGSL